MTPIRRAYLLVAAARQAGTLIDATLLAGTFERTTKLRTSRSAETPLHKIATSFEPALSVALRHAFAVARKALKGDPVANVEKAVGAMRKALEATLPATLRRVLVAGGQVAAGSLKTLGDVEGHPFHGNQWTGGTASEVKVDDELLNIAVKDSQAMQHPHKGDIESDVQGVIIGSPRALDKSINRGDVSLDEVKKDFKATREYLREKYGDTLKMYRVDAPVEKHSEKTRTVYMGDKKLADRFGESRAYVVKTDEVVAVYATKSGYYEFIVEKPKEGLRLHDSKVRGLQSEGDGRYVGYQVARGLSLRLRTAKAGDKPKLDFSFDAKNQSAIDWADRHAAELIDGIAETSRTQINNAIADALETGDFADALDEILAAVGDEQRAELIARHETMLAVSEGQRQAWDQAVDEGYLTGDEVRTWLVTGDDKVCPICDALDGATAKLGEPYESDGEEYDGPPAHVMCRCTEGISA